MRYGQFYTRECVHGLVAVQCRVCCAHLHRRDRDRGPSPTLVVICLLWLGLLLLGVRALDIEAEHPPQTLSQRLGVTDK